MSTNTESGWTTVGSGGGWRARMAARGGAGGPSEPPMTRTSLGERSGYPSGGGWGRASGGGERSGYPSGGGRPMPAAFGGGERDRRNERLEEQRRRAAEDEERKRREEREAAEAAKRLAKKMDFKDEEEYPALGGAGAAKSKVTPKPGLDFRAAGERGAILGAAREAEEEARAREEYYASYSARLEAEERAAHRRRLAQITTRCYDDGFYEHEPPEEDEDDGHYMDGAAEGEDMGGMPEFEDDEEGDENLREAGAGHRAAGEFNAHLAVNRRRGDKSDW